MKKLIALLLALVMVIGLVACGNTNAPAQTDAPAADAPATDAPAQEDDTPAETEAPAVDPLGAYEETIEFTVGTAASTAVLTDGVSTRMDNPYKDYICETLNIDYTYYYEDKDAVGYQQAIDLALVSEEFPDIFFVDILQYQELIEMDAIWDMTEIFEEYASDEVKAMYEEYKTIYNEDPVGKITVDGRIYGVPQSGSGGDHAMMGIWLRQDWLDALNLDPDPDGDKMMTLDDLEAVTQAFVDNDPGNSGNPVGISMLPWIGLGNYLSPPFVTRSVGNVQHLNFYRDENGKAYYGSFGSESNPVDAKEVLTWWRDMYDKGLVDPDFVSTQWTDESLGSKWANGNCGVVFLPETGPTDFLSLGYQSSPDAHFSFYALDIGNGMAGGYTSANQPGYTLVVSKDFEHPELAVKLVNIREQVEMDAELYAQVCGSLGTPSTLGPVDISNTKANFIGKLYTYATDYLADKITKNDIPANYHTWLDVLDKYKEDPTSLDATERAKYDTIMEGAAVYNKMSVEGRLGVNQFENIILNHTTESVTSGEKFYAELYPLEEEYVMKIIAGQKDVDDWDEFVDLWYEYGGAQILKELDEYYAANN